MTVVCLSRAWPYVKNGRAQEAKQEAQLMLTTPWDMTFYVNVNRDIAYIVPFSKYTEISVENASTAASKLILNFIKAIWQVTVIIAVF